MIEYRTPVPGTAMQPMSRSTAILRQRCPRCRSGRVFDGVIRMRASCPSCSHRFEREPGYFTGAMYISYALAVPIFAVIFLLIRRLLPEWPDVPALGAALPLFLPCVPLIVRYSRIIWMHIDLTFNSER